MEIQRFLLRNAGIFEALCSPTVQARRLLFVRLMILDPTGGVSTVARDKLCVTLSMVYE